MHCKDSAALNDLSFSQKAGFLSALQPVWQKSFERRENLLKNSKIMLGNAAIAQGAYEAGVKVSAAYPGTPSTEISECIAKYPEVYAEWSPNEKVAMEVAIGASIAGARAMA